MTSTFNQSINLSVRRKWIAVILCVITLTGAILLFLNKNRSEQGMKIVTEYYDFYYPRKWRKNLRTEECNGYVTFYGLVEGQQEVPLFKIHFGEGEGTLMGAIKIKNGEKINVYLTTYSLSPNGIWSHEQLDTVYSMGEDLNFLLSKITFEEPIFSGVEFQQTEVAEDNMIHTPYGILYYPGNWNNSLRIEIEEDEQYTISFYYNEKNQEQIRLFDICIGKESAGAIGRRKLYDGTYAYVKIIDYAAEEKEGLSKAQQNTILDMIDAVNYTLEKLSLEKVVGNSNVEKPTVSNNEIVLNTPYVDLKYPGEWSSMLRVENIVGKVHTVAFYGKVEGMDEVHLFDVIFGDVVENPIGTLMSKKNSRIIVGMNVYPISYDDSLTEEQKDKLFSMQDALNYVVDNLQLLETCETTENEVYGSPNNGEILEEDIAVQTPYGQLKYPAKWKGLVRAEQKTDDVFSVSYWGNINDKEYPLFTIIFGCTEDMSIGTIVDDNGRTVCVGIKLADPPIEDTITQENKAMFYEMQEDANYLISMLDIR